MQRCRPAPIHGLDLFLEAAFTISNLVQSLGLDVMAESVETEAQRGFLARHGCCNHQDYLFSQPLRIEQLEEFMLENKTLAQGKSGSIK